MKINYKKQYNVIQIQNQKDIKLVEGKLIEKENEIEILNRNDQNKSDTIAALADKIEELVLEIERLKRSRYIDWTPLSHSLYSAP